MIKALVRLGWTVARVSGSHHILTQAGIREDEFFEAY